MSLDVESKLAQPCGQLALRRLLSASDHASGCPSLRPASANPPRGRLWPAIAGLGFRHGDGRRQPLDL
eukprot:scaffold80614_cov29-Phaeocystis_antarctica.AAC.1